MSLYYEENSIALQEIAYIAKLNDGYPEDSLENQKELVNYIENKGIKTHPQEYLLLELNKVNRNDHFD